jgi:hypothetical protein
LRRARRFGSNSGPRNWCHLTFSIQRTASRSSRSDLRGVELIGRRRMLQKALKKTALKDDSGPFMHACHCGKWGYFGYEVMLCVTRRTKVYDPRSGQTVVRRERDCR